jgi:Pyruvate/2-oxoacid:ferredoxin oxidoreductase delta subunit
MTVRKIVRIDEEKCDGCGQCIPNCREGALRVVDGKARLVSDRYCDGLGACLGVCPRDAITVIEREADEFDEQAVAAFHAVGGPHMRAAHGGCPGAALMSFAAGDDAAPASEPSDSPSALRQWPVQLELVPVNAPFFDGADLLLVADCVPFAVADFHARFLRGRKLLVGCPKLDDTARYAAKLAAILKGNDIRSLTIVHMEVPCCFGLVALARRALAESEKQVPVQEVVVGVQGAVREREAAVMPTI